MHKKLIFALGLAVCSMPGQAIDLTGVYRLAEQQDPEIAQAAAARDAAIEAKPQSRALLLPTATVNASMAKNQQEVLSSSGITPVGKSNYDTTGYGLTVNQPLFHYDSIKRLSQANKILARAEADYGAAQQALILRVAENYLEALAAKDNLAFAQAEKNATERQLEQTRQRFEVGLVAITDVHEAQAAYDLVTAQEIDAENLLSSRFEALREITGEYHDTLALLSEDLPLNSPQPEDIGLWQQRALQQNLPLLSARLQAEATQDEIAINRAGHYPTLDLSASYDYNDSEGGAFGGREIEDTQVLARLTIPLYQGGAVNSQTREAIARYTQAKEILEQQQRATLRQARDGYRNVIAAIRRVTALQQAVISAESALTATEAGLEVGTRTTVDVLNVRRNLFRAQRDMARSRYEYILQTLRLKQASGQLNTQDIIEFNQWMKTK